MSRTWIVNAAWLALGVAAVAAAILVSGHGRAAHARAHSPAVRAARSSRPARQPAAPSAAARPLTVLATGDSEIQELDAFLAQDLGRRAHVRSFARISS